MRALVERALRLLEGANDVERRRLEVQMTMRNAHDDPATHKGAIEGDRPTDTQYGNANAPGVDEDGLPSDPIKTAEDALGANEDETEGG
jgi:hypothetical protein